MKITFMCYPNRLTSDMHIQPAPAYRWLLQVVLAYKWLLQVVLYSWDLHKCGCCIQLTFTYK